MKVSVIIAAYNIEKYIQRCIESVVNQSEREIEIIIVNDGSTDNTLNIINKVNELDDRIIVINKKNQGLIEARKTGLKYANGEFILFLDGDDWLENNCIEELYKTANDKKADVVLYNAYMVYDDRKEIFDTFIEKFIDDIKKNPVKNLLLLNISPTIWSKFIKKSFLEENNIEFPQNISYAEDLAAVLNIFINKPKIVCNEKRFYNYYQRNDSISNKISSKVLEIDDAIQFIKEKLVEMNIYYENKEEFEYTVFRHLLISKILRFNYLYPERKKVFQQYKARNIDINKNKYIIRDLSYGNRNLKLRINLYNLNYSIATLCDKSLGYVK
ncbi:glycosyltransferase family 2 protein [uncultured Clostridium sp.]|uniref:glycosyltransferase family 2 protein n=1 Tax=uncultured Clostridium sp. TaxID=59620 RepID=UPI002671F497|nr:glycosyltransferase family 2 protein [uncultured Clostridium sp.]